MDNASAFAERNAIRTDGSYTYTCAAVTCQATNHTLGIPQCGGTHSRPAEAEVDPPQAQRNAERSEMWGKHSESPTAHQDNLWGVIPWYKLSEEQLTMTLCGAFRGEARHGQVDASWDLFSSFQVFKLQDARRVWSLSLRCEFVFFLFLPCPKS